MKHITPVIVALALYTAPWVSSEAHAGSQSLLTLGIGAELGYGQYNPNSNDPMGGFIAELTARVRLFRILGVQFSYNLTGAIDTGDLSFSSKYRLTGILYLLPNRRVSVYVMGGVGARDIREIISVTGATNSYHLGAGIEVYFGRRFAISLEYCWIVPGYASMEQSVQAEIDSARPTISDVPEGESATVPLGYSLPEINVMDFLDAGNFQATLGLRFYL